MKDENGRTCTYCYEYKPYNEYYPKKNGYMGFTSRCKECDSIKGKEYRRNNPEKERERSRRYYEENREEILIKDKIYREENSEYIKEYRRKFRKENPDKMRYHEQNRSPEAKEARREWRKQYYRDNPDKWSQYKLNRRARELSLPNTLTECEIKEIHSLFNGCSLSDEKDDIHLDHFIPLSTGYGGTFKGNMIPLHSELNLSKGSQNPFEWVKWKEGIDLDKFDRVVEYLAEINGMTYDEYKDYVYQCFESEGGVA